MDDALFELDAKRNELKCAVDALGLIHTAADNRLSGEQELANALSFVFGGLFDLQADISKFVDELFEERKKQ